ncbi:C40 family peptidase [Solibacillus sp. FSL K6-1554]|uniref:C40 family peptidase n=1 Tax=Solibacillus sp. FSL K6-1554 TaxID=2921472 RepID=UPI0030FB0931
MKKKILLPIFATFMIFSGVGMGSNNTAQAASVSELTATASKYIGVPYVYGGTTASGLDCSGFTQLVFKQLGFDLNRTAASQYKQGSAVSKSDLQPGDLVFFNTTGKVASHVGISLGGNKFVHAGTSTGVTEASLNSSYWAKRYNGAKRVASFGESNKVVAAVSSVEKEEVKDSAIDFTIYASRGEVAIQLAKTLGLDTSDTNSPFSDIKSSSKYAGAATALYKLGVFTGDEGKFNPASPLTRAQMAKVLVKAFDLKMKQDTLKFTDVPTSHWAHNDISILASNGITVGKGDGTFGTNDNVMLKHLTAFINRLQ